MSLTRLLLILSLFALSVCVGVDANAATLRVREGMSLQQKIDEAKEGDTLLLSAGTFRATPRDFRDRTCGNCLNASDGAVATYGIRIADKSLTIAGAGPEKTTIITGAGYGVYIENAPTISISELTITGGKRDADGNATDAGIVVRQSRAFIKNVTIKDNTERDTAVVVGICGIVGREGAILVIEDCRIVNNTWDGIALYRGAHAEIHDCLISGGRGAGIGITWDASCVAIRNEVTGFWKGIGTFGTSRLVARNNYIHHQLGWGLIATGESTLEAANNHVHANGNCGIAIWSSESRGSFVNNIVTGNGWRDEWVCPCVGVVNMGDFSKWIFRNNLVWGNKAGDYRDLPDQTGKNENISFDPGYWSDSSFHPRLYRGDSLLTGRGDSTIRNIDGTRSSPGLFGGPFAWPK